MKRAHLVAPWLLLLVLHVQAQESIANPSQIVAQDSMITVVPLRSPAEITTAIENAKRMLGQADSKRTRMQTLLVQADSRIEIKQREIDLIDKRIDVAEDAKKESEVSSLEAELKVAKELLDILKSQRTVREAESDMSLAEFEYFAAMLVALESEQALNSRRSEHVALASGGTSDVSEPGEIVGDLMTKTLEAQLNAAKKEQAYADRKRDLGTARVKLHSLQRNFSATKK